MTYPDALAWLYAAQQHGIKLGLENTRRLLAELGFAHRQKFLHVAGTNGKGSVCAMLAAMLQAAGFRIGLYTSPHLVTFRERIQIDGVMIDEETVAAELTRIRELVGAWSNLPTFFEMTTALGLLHFQREAAEFVVLETGLGGRLDATNVVTPEVSVITPIALDHQAYLGETLVAIAAEKAGIIKPGVPVVSALQPPEVEEVLRRTAAERQAPFLQPAALPGDWAVGLPGAHQRTNAALALAAFEHGKINVSEEAARQGLQSVNWPGRFQRLGARIVLDGAHNPAAAAQLAQTWREKFGGAQATIILGVLSDKAAGEICAALNGIAARVFPVAVQNSRSLDPAALRGLWETFSPGRCAAPSDLPTALSRAEQHPEPILITGSLFLIGEAFAQLNALPRDAGGSQ